MEAPIPEDWLKPVLRILKTGRFHHEISVPRGTQDRWDAGTLGAAFLGDVRDPLIAALSMPGVRGKLIPDQPEPGITYAFWFYYGRTTFYGKICLYDNKVKIKLLSAHLPDHGTDHL